MQRPDEDPWRLEGDVEPLRTESGRRIDPHGLALFIGLRDVLLALRERLRRTVA